MWADKYAPETLGRILGNENSVKKVHNWVKSFKPKQKTKILLIIGKSGIGKTTTASVIAKTLGYSLMEFNASDARSAKMVKELIFDNYTLDGYFGKSQSITKKQLILMDEVDGMPPAGITELIKLSKTSKWPIVCICNDETTGVRKLSSQSEKIRFYPVPLNKLISRLRTILKAEGHQKTVSLETLNEIIESCNGDVRKTLNELQYHCLNTTQKTTVENEFKVPTDSIFTTVGSLFKSKDNLSIDQSLEYYFADNFMVPLFVQENYLKGINNDFTTTTTNKMMRASESLSLSENLNNEMGINQNYEIMPFHGITSTLMPLKEMDRSSFRINFPGILGKSSTTLKNYNITTDLQSKMANKRKHLHASNEFFYYLAKLIVNILKTKEKDGIDQVIDMLAAYDLNIDDYKSLMGMTDTDLKCIPTKVKSALTRQYKKKIKTI